MDERVMPFAVPYVENEAEEAIAVLGSVVDSLLDDHFHAVSALRQRAARYSLAVFALAVLGTLLFLMQDFERAPLWQLVLAGVVPLGLVLLGRAMRTQWIEAEKFVPPRATLARKLSWEWIAIPISEDRLILWDTLSDEGESVQLPSSPPNLQTWMLQESFPPFESLTDEKRLIRGMAPMLDAWRQPLMARRLPVVEPGAQQILDYLMSFPRRSERLAPAPSLPGPRSVDEGMEDVEALLRLYQKLNIFMRRLAAWEEALPNGRRSVVAALAQTQPTLEPPPPLPEGHPMNAAASLLSTLDVVRSRALTPLQSQVAEELEQLVERRDRERGVLEQDWQRERNAVSMSNDTLLMTLRRQILALEGHTLPEAERTLQESEARLTAEQQRVIRDEHILQEQRKTLAQLNTDRADTPQASDARRAQVVGEISRLQAKIPETKRGIALLADMVAIHRGTVDRVRRQLQDLKDELATHVATQEAALNEIENRFTTQEGMLNARFGPEIEALQADIAFFGAVHDQLSDQIKLHRTDLAMENQQERAYTQVVQEANNLLSAKQQAVQAWVDAISVQIGAWRSAAERVVAAIDAHALANAGTMVQRFYVPLWYVETTSTEPTMWPWQQGEVRASARFIGPMIKDPQGTRMALSKTRTPHMQPLPALQQRLARLMNDEAGQHLQEEARRVGTPVSFNATQLDQVARATAMPRAMFEALRTERLGLAAPQEGHPARVLAEADAEDRFFDDHPTLPDDAWAGPNEPALDDDAWLEEPPSRGERSEP